MRNLSIGILLAVLMGTVGIYAASISGSTKTLGGTGSVTVTAPASTSSVTFVTDSAGLVTTANVTWTPAANSNYTIKVSAGGSTGSATITASGTISRTDPVTLTPSVAANLVTSATVVISES